MANTINPVITFKAGLCEVDDSSKPYKVKPVERPGYIYIYQEDDLPHFCWRARNAPYDRADLDLIMFPGDGSFEPYQPKSDGPNPKPLTNGRIYVLRFSSSSSRHLFWLQSKSQHASGDPSHFSARDYKLGEVVNQLLQGEEVDVQQAMANLSDAGDGDDDTAMEDTDGPGEGRDLHRAASGGAGAGATGGDIREEGEGPREGGADGGRAAAPGQSDEMQSAVSNFLRSLQGDPNISAGQQQPQQPGQQSSGQGSRKLYTTLPDLLPPSTTIPVINSLTEGPINALLAHLPPQILLLAQEGTSSSETFSHTADPNPETVEAAIQALSLGQKKDILERVLRSPQFSQSLGSLTMALRDGGLPSIADALKIKVANGGFMARGGVPLGGGEAVEAFVNGIKDAVLEENGKKEKDEDAEMES